MCSHAKVLQGSIAHNPFLCAGLKTIRPAAALPFALSTAVAPLLRSVMRVQHPGYWQQVLPILIMAYIYIYDI